MGSVMTGSVVTEASKGRTLENREEENLDATKTTAFKKRAESFEFAMAADEGSDETAKVSREFTHSNIGEAT